MYAWKKYGSHMDTDTRGRLFGCVFPLAVIMLIFANRVLICTSSFRLKYSTHVCYFAHWAKQSSKNNSCLKTKDYVWLLTTSLPPLWLYLATTKYFFKQIWLLYLVSRKSMFNIFYCIIDQYVLWII